MSESTRNNVTAKAVKSNIVPAYASYVKACRATEKVEKDYGTALDGAVAHLESTMAKYGAWWEPSPEGDVKQALEFQRKAHANAWAEGFKDPKKIKSERSKASTYWARIINKVRDSKKPQGDGPETTDYTRSCQGLVTIYNRGTKEGAEPESIELSKALKPILLARKLISAS